MAGKTLARSGQPGPRRQDLSAQDLEGWCAMRVRAVVRFRPRDQRAARRRQIDRAYGVGTVRQSRRRPEHPEIACEALGAGDLLCAGRVCADLELRDGGKSIGRMAWGQYGNRVGVPSILKLLAKHSVLATFYVPAVCALL